MDYTPHIYCPSRAIITILMLKCHHNLQGVGWLVLSNPSAALFMSIFIRYAHHPWNCDFNQNRAVFSNGWQNCSNCNNFNGMFWKKCLRFESLTVIALAYPKNWVHSFNFMQTDLKKVSATDCCKNRYMLWGILSQKTTFELYCSYWVAY